MAGIFHKIEFELQGKLKWQELFKDGEVKDERIKELELKMAEVAERHQLELQRSQEASSLLEGS